MKIKFSQLILLLVIFIILAVFLEVISLFGKSIGNKIGNYRAPASIISSSTILSQTYSSTDYGFSLRYPKGFKINENYEYYALGPNKSIPGVSFTIPLIMASDTNLASDSYLSVEINKSAPSCDAKYFLDNVIDEQVENDNGITWSVGHSLGAGAGNLYEEWIYALPTSSPCIAVRYFIHSGNIHNYPIGMVKEFDRSSLLKTFDAIRQSFLLVK